MSRLTFYRKYRSQNFNEICGQTHIVDTLKNAISNKRLSHAYIFSGPRGTGKTSIARIFAKAVNTFQEENQFDTLDNAICTRITKGLCVDIVEIDAASNTGVDNIRDLNDKVNFAPVECKTKFYIIDEAHMLSTGAFNALLKTLEEPPSHTIFVLATTEPHKIPITIHSRCQHLRFRNLTHSEIEIQLRHICKEEQISISNEGLSIISQNSSGCMRDALSLFDQIYSFKGNTISDNDILDILGAAKSDQVLLLFDSLFKKDKDKTHQLLNDIFSAGINPFQLIHDCIEIGKNILAKQCNNDEIIKLYKDQIISLASQSNLKETADLLETFAKIESETRWFSNPELLIQIRLIQFITQDNNEQLVFKKTTPKEIQKQNITTPSIKSQPTPPSTIQNQTTQPIQAEKPTPPPAIQKPDVQIERPHPITKEETSINNPTPTSNSQHQTQPVKSDINKSWEAILENIRKEKPATFSMIRHSKIIRNENNCLTIKLQQSFSFFFEKLKEPTQMELIKEFIKKELNQDYDITFDESINNSTQPTEESTQNKTDAFSSSSESTEEKSSSSINTIVNMFDGSIL